jgi:chromosome segregation ATPase
MGNIMKQQLEERLAALRAEYQQGEGLMTEYERKRTELHETMLRISGAIQVLEEELRKAENTPRALTAPSELK